MERDYGKELDDLRGELAKIQALLTGTAPRGVASAQSENVSAAEADRVGEFCRMKRMHPNSHVQAIMNEDTETAARNGWTGAVTYLGVYSSGGRQSNWIKHCVDTGALLSVIDDVSAAKVLDCIGSQERLRLLQGLLLRPSTVAELVGTCGFGSTGQGYHLLRPLLAADLVVEDKEVRGRYHIQPHRVQGILMLLAGIADMLDVTFTKGSFEPEAGAADEVPPR